MDGAANNRALLTTKNIQALKALFNIAHTLGPLLGLDHLKSFSTSYMSPFSFICQYLSSIGGAWLSIFETYEQLDLVIHVSNELAHKMKR
jgi:hypothetical protein